MPTTTPPSTNSRTRTRTRAIRPPARYDQANFPKTTPDPKKKEEQRNAARAREGEIPFPQSPDVPGVVYNNRIQVISSRKPSVPLKMDNRFDEGKAREIALRARERWEGREREGEEWVRREEVRKRGEEAERLEEIGREEVVRVGGERRDMIEGFLRGLGVQEGEVALRRLWQAGLVGRPAESEEGALVANGSQNRSFGERFSIDYEASPNAARCRRIIDVGGPEWQQAVAKEEPEVENETSPTFAGEFGEELDFSDSEDSKSIGSLNMSPTSSQLVDFTPQPSGLLDGEVEGTHKKWSELSDGVKFTIYQELRKTRADGFAFQDLYLTEEEQSELQNLIEAEVERFADEQECDEKLQKRMNKLFSFRGQDHPNRGMISPQEIMDIIEEERYEGPPAINNFITQKEVEDGMSYLESIELPSEWLKGYMGQLTYSKPGDPLPEPAFQSFFVPGDGFDGQDDGGNRPPEALEDMDRDDMTIEQLKARIEADPIIENYQHEIDSGEDDPRWETPNPSQTGDSHDIYRIEPEAKAPPKKQNKRPRSESPDGANMPKIIKKARTEKHKLPTGGTRDDDVSIGSRSRGVSSASPSRHLVRKPSGLRHEINLISSPNDHEQDQPSESAAKIHTPMKVESPSERGGMSTPNRRSSNVDSSSPYPKSTPTGIILKFNTDRGRAAVQVISPNASQHKDSFSEEEADHTPKRRNVSSPVVAPSSQEKRRPQPHSPGNQRSGRNSVPKTPPSGPVELSYDPRGKIMVRSVDSQNRDGKMTPNQTRNYQTSPVSVKARVAEIDRIQEHHSSPPTQAHFSPNSTLLGPSTPQGNSGPLLPDPSPTPDPSSSALNDDQARDELSKIEQERNKTSFRELNYVLSPHHGRESDALSVPNVDIPSSVKTPSRRKKATPKNWGPTILSPSHPDYVGMSPEQKKTMDKVRMAGANRKVMSKQSSSTAHTNEGRGASQNQPVNPGQADHAMLRSPQQTNQPGNPFGNRNHTASMSPNNQANWAAGRMMNSQQASPAQRNGYPGSPASPGVFSNITRSVNSTTTPAFLEATAPFRTANAGMNNGSPSFRTAAELAAHIEKTTKIGQQVDRYLHHFVDRLIKDQDFRSRFAPSAWLLGVEPIANSNFERSFQVAKNLIHGKTSEHAESLRVWYNNITGVASDTVVQESPFTFQNMLIHSSRNHDDRNRYLELTKKVHRFINYFCWRVREDENFRVNCLPAAKILGFDTSGDVHNPESESYRAAQKFVWINTKYAHNFANCFEAWERSETKIEETHRLELELKKVGTKSSMANFLFHLINWMTTEGDAARREMFKSWMSLLRVPQKHGSDLNWSNEEISRVTDGLLARSYNGCRQIVVLWARMQKGGEDSSAAYEQLHNYLNNQVVRRPQREMTPEVQALTRLGREDGSPVNSPRYSSPGYATPVGLYASPKTKAFIKMTLTRLEKFLESYGPDLLEKLDQDKISKMECTISMRACGLQKVDSSGVRTRPTLDKAARWFLNKKGTLVIKVSKLLSELDSNPSNPEVKARLDGELERMTRDEKIEEAAQFLRHFAQRFQNGDTTYKTKWKQLLGACKLVQSNGSYVEDHRRLAERLLDEGSSFAESLAEISPFFRLPVRQEETYRKLEEIMSLQVDYITNQVQKYLQAFSTRLMTMNESARKMWQPAISRHRLIGTNGIEQAAVRNLAPNLVLGDFDFCDRIAALQDELEKLEQGTESILDKENEMDELLYGKLIGPGDVETVPGDTLKTADGRVPQDYKNYPTADTRMEGVVNESFLPTNGTLRSPINFNKNPYK